MQRVSDLAASLPAARIEQLSSPGLEISGPYSGKTDIVASDAGDFRCRTG